MNIHKNARTTPLGREAIVARVRSGQSPEAAASRATAGGRAMHGGSAGSMSMSVWMMPPASPSRT